MNDVRLAVRSLAKQPFFTLLIVGILALGIAGTTTVFSLFDGLFLRPFPIPHQDRVVELYETSLRPGGAYGGVSYSAFDTWRRYNKSFACMGFCSFWAANLSVHDGAQRVSIRLVTHDFLDVLGLRPVLGRGFTAEDDRPGAPNVVLLSYGLWRHRFAKDPSIVGRTIHLDSDAYTVVGVLPPEAAFPEPKDVWEPLRADPLKGHGGMGSLALGRLKEHVTVQQAREDLARIHQGWIQQHPEKEKTRPAVALLVNQFRRQLKNYRFGTSLLLGVVGFVLLMVCCNIASILLARGTYRVREIALCAALGATPRRIMQRVLVESLVLSTVGGILGIVLGTKALQILLGQLTDMIPSWMHFEPDIRCALFSIFVVFLATILSGLLPALQAAFPGSLPVLLRSMSARSVSSPGQQRSLKIIVTAEVALALTLLIGAGLLVRTFLQVRNVDPGFRRSNVLTYNISLPIGPYYDENKRRAFWDRHLERVRALPGVHKAALSTYLPMTWALFGQFEVEEAHRSGLHEPLSAIEQKVTSGYFATLGIGIVAGRAFKNLDNRKDAEKVAIVSETFAKRGWPGTNAVGRRIRRQGSADWIRVVGVAKDVVNSGMDLAVEPAVYEPVAGDVPFGMFGIVQTEHDPMGSMASIRRLVHNEDPELPIQNIWTLSRWVDHSIGFRRLTAWLFGVPAASAALIAFAGIFGVFSYAVNRRTQEIGVRMALGARPKDVLSLVIFQALRLISTGLAFGVLGGLVLGRLFTQVPGMLFRTRLVDPATLIGGFFVLTALALLACYIPARRAANVDPMEALRAE